MISHIHAVDLKAEHLSKRAPVGDLNGRDTEVIETNYQTLFFENVDKRIAKLEKQEKRSRTKATVMKVVFIALAVLAILTLISSAILGGLSAYSVLAISTSAIYGTVMSLVIGSSLLASGAAILNFPKNFVKSFISDALRFHEKAEFLKDKIHNEDLVVFMEAELANRDFLHPEKIVSASKFVKLFYTINNIIDKLSDVEKYKKEVEDCERTLRNSPIGLSLAEVSLQHKIEEQLVSAKEILKTLDKQIIELENEANDIRGALRDLDRQPS